MASKLENNYFITLTPSELIVRVIVKLIVIMFLH